MKLAIKAKLTILFLIGIFTLITVACTGEKSLTPEEIYAQSREKSEDIKTAHIKMEIAVEGQGLNVTMTGDGVTEVPDKFHFYMETPGQKLEVLALSKTERYGRVVGEEQWTPFDSSSQLITGPDALGLIQLPENVANIQKKVDEKIDGVDCYHLTVNLSFQESYEKATPAPDPELMKSLSQPIDVDLWVAKSDMLARKIKYAFNLKIQDTDAKYLIDLTFSNLNEPVTINNLAAEEIKPTETPIPVEMGSRHVSIQGVDGNVSITYIDVSKLEADIQNGNLQATFYLGDIPEKLTFNRLGVPNNALEYGWKVLIDVDGDLATGATEDMYQGIDYSLAASYYARDYPPNEAPIQGRVQVDVWQLKTGGTSSIVGKAYILVDTIANTITLTGAVPGIGLRSKLVFVTFDYNPGNEYQTDRSR